MLARKPNVRTVGVFEAKTQLSRLLARVAKGERITITRHGVPVAELCPLAGTPFPEAVAAAARIRERAKGQYLRGLKIRDLVAAGRRY